MLAPDVSDPLVLSAILYALSVAVFLAYRRYFRASAVRYPPGPSGYPIMGDWTTMIERHAHLYYAKLTKQYGDVVYLTSFKTKILILGGYETTNQPFGKRGSIYSGRPRLAVTDIMLGSDAPPMSDYGPKWREERRLYHAYLGRDTVVDRYGSTIEANVQRWIWSSAQLAKVSSASFDKTVGRILLSAVYGIELASDDDDLIINTLGVSGLATPTAVPGAELANEIPFLLRLPTWLTGLPFKAKAGEVKFKVGRLAMAPFQRALDPTDEASTRPSFTQDMLNSETTLTKDQIMLNSASSLLAGLDTTAATVQNFIRAMMTYPEVQKKAQAEIDQIIGRDRLPSFEDHGNLPYLQALFREVLRWSPAVSFGLIHMTTQDDVYNGWAIPKGTIVTSNGWAMSRDEREYSDPDTFRPERFLGANPEMDPKLWAFGVGRRVCPGMNMGENVVLTTLATILATVDVVKADTTPEVFQYAGKLINPPLPYDFRFVPRFEGAMAMLSTSVDV